ncbi:MAG: hypothetical protein E7345_02190 [Clostridiales bacterium]|nr:hypothetical protein [Clostridiales bacterium]
MENVLNGIILSNEIEYVNNIRSKCLSIGLQLEKVNSLSDMIVKIFTLKKGFILLDARYPSQILSLLYNYLIKTNILDFKLIILEDFEVVKHFDDYGENCFRCTASNVVDLIKSIQNSDKNISLNGVSDKFLIEKISFELDKLGLSDSMKGYDYLVECLLFEIRNRGRKLNLYNEIYLGVASIFNVDISNVEKCVRVAINKIKKDKTKYYTQIFGDVKLTSKIFIERFSKHIINIIKSS